MRQGGTRIDPRMGRVLAELNNRFQEVAISGDDDVLDLVMSIENSAGQVSTLLGEEHHDDEKIRPLLLDIAVGALALIQSIDMTAEREFHRQRRMFYIIGDLMTIGIEGDERGHREWMHDEGDEDSYDEAIRGYVDKTGIYAYKGRDFGLSPAAQSEFAGHFPSLVEKMNLDAELTVYAGVVPGRIGIRWPGRTKLGLVKDLMNWTL